MDKTQTVVCAVCKTALGLTRRQVHAIAVAVKQAGKERYFVPEDEVHQIVHSMHNKFAEESNKE